MNKVLEYIFVIHHSVFSNSGIRVYISSKDFCFILPTGEVERSLKTFLCRSCSKNPLENMYH